MSDPSMRREENIGAREFKPGLDVAYQYCFICQKDHEPGDTIIVTMDAGGNHVSICKWCVQHMFYELGD
jgi:hypothetical protein